MTDKYLLLDSTEITGHWNLQTSRFDQIALLSGWRVAVPAAVFEEVVGNHGRYAEEVFRTFPASNDRLKKLGLPTVEYSKPQQDYRYLLEVALLRVDAAILPWPSDGHDILTRRAISRTPPFDRKGGGYRDTLVWLSALALARQGHEVALATRDTAFGENRELKPQLIREIEEVEGSIELIGDLDQWLKNQTLASSEVGLARDELDSMVDEVSRTFLGPWGFEDVSLRSDECGFGSHVGMSRIISAGLSRTVEVPRARKLQSGDVYLEIELIDDFDLSSEISLYSNTPNATPEALANRSTPFEARSTVRLEVLFKITFFARYFDDPERGDQDQEETDDISDGEVFQVEMVQFAPAKPPEEGF